MNGWTNIISLQSKIYNNLEVELEFNFWLSFDDYPVNTFSFVIYA